MTHPCDSLLSLTLVVGKSVYLKICSRIFCMLMTSTIYKYICKQKTGEFQFLQINGRVQGRHLAKYEFDDRSRVAGCAASSWNNHCRCHHRHGHHHHRHHHHRHHHHRHCHHCHRRHCHHHHCHHCHPHLAHRMLAVFLLVKKGTVLEQFVCGRRWWNKCNEENKRNEWK